MFATDHTTLLRGLRIALHGIVKTHLQTTRPHLRLPDLLQTADAPAAFRAPRPLAAGTATATAAAGGPSTAAGQGAAPYRLEVHADDRRPRPILVVGMTAPGGTPAGSRPRPAALMPPDLGMPGVMEVCLIQVAPWQATVWRRDASPWDLRRTWTAAHPAGDDSGDDPDRPHPCWQREQVDSDQDLVLTSIDFSIPLTRLIHIAGLTGAWQPA